jgi:hypothetical protein
MLFTPYYNVFVTVLVSLCLITASLCLQQVCVGVDSFIGASVTTM